jgi:lambda family phage portal protein
MVAPVRWIARQLGYTPITRRAGFDAARTTDENRKHWANADSLSAVSQLTTAVRKTLRDRCRYEVQNNCFAAGVIRTLVGDTIGSGPRLQMLTSDAALNAAVEEQWRLWTAATDHAMKLRILAGVKYVTGECFAVYRDSKRLEQLGFPVTLDIRLIEPDQVSDGIYGQLFTRAGDDGIVVDENDEVSAYKILKRHPGDNRMYGGLSLQPDEVPSENVLHWFEPQRPGQLRGFTELAPALPIFGQLRRYTSATLTAAEVAAMLAGVLETPLAPDEEPIRSSTLWDTIELVRGTLLTLPAGYKASQFQATQPTAGYDQFVKAKIRECGRAINMPYGKVAGDHSEYNYSSARLDNENYWLDRQTERNALQVKVFDPCFYRWCDFARFAIPHLAAFRGRWWELKHVWHYDARISIDPVKDANGDERNLTNGTDTLAAIAARDGTTVDELLDQRARERDGFIARGLPLPVWLTGAPQAASPSNATQPTNDDEEVPAHAA